MKAQATRTLNPLHFEDLEPHRFEDLVRQLAYDFRTWRSIEATGRLGSDEGMDIRAVEMARDEPEPTGDEIEGAIAPATADRLWIFQCKRERHLGPTRVRDIVKESIPTGAAAPFGLLLAAACDFSLKARNAFHEEARARGVQEGHVWGKAEIEDMLLLAKNDHLLFAYFNISLQVRRRSLRTELRSRLATKRELIRVLGNIRGVARIPLFVRDPREERYPSESDIADFHDFPRWLYVTFVGHEPPDHVLVIVRKHFAYVDDAGERWDALLNFVDLPDGPPENLRLHRRNPERDSERARYRAWWDTNVPERNQAILSIMRCIHYDRILAIDEHGDSENAGVHLLAEFDREQGPFEAREYPVIDFGSLSPRQRLFPTSSTRVAFFPSDIPTRSPGTTADDADC